MLAEVNREGVGHNWGKYCIGLFPVSEHLGHFKLILKKSGENGNCLVFPKKKPLFFCNQFLFMPYLISVNWKTSHLTELEFLFNQNLIFHDTCLGGAVILKYWK